MTGVQRSIAVLAGAFCLVALAYWQGETKGRRSVTLAQLEQGKRRADVARAAAVETVTVRERSKAKIDTLVQVVDDHTLSVQETPTAPVQTIAVPALVVSRIVINDSLIASYRRLVVRDSTAIRYRDSLLAAPRPRSHWGLGVAGGYSCAATGCRPGVTVGLVWRW